MAEPDTRPAPPRADDEARTLGELFRRLSADASALIRQEMALARAELRRNVRALAADAGRVAAGGFVAALGALVLLEALVFGLGDAMGRRYWLSALIVAAVLLAAGGAMLAIGMRRARTRRLAPAETLESLRETGGWARDEVSGLRETLTGDGAAPPAARAHSPAPRAIASPGTAVRGDGDRATSPTRADGPPREWPLWKRVRAKMKQDDVSNQAAKVAYYFFMSLPPLLMAGFGAAGIFGGDRTADTVTANLQSNLPAEAGALVNGFVTEVVRKDHPGLLSIGLLLALWSGSAVFIALEDSLNAAWGVTSTRGFVKRRAVAVGTLVGVGALFLAGSVVLLAGGAIAEGWGLGMAWKILQWPLGLALVVGAFWIVYYVLPGADQRRHKGTLLKASALAAGLWLLATLGFRLYAANFGSYSKTYGLLGGIIVLLLWMYYTSTVILLGGEVASEMERG
ncbi:MAG TPA: YhjD/YihY/BrkB family envelope integrity protein [Longimicrobium sp.]